MKRMARIKELTLKGVRCFATEQSAKLGRITLLVGENGCGKSTFLGCYRALAKLANLVDLRDDNHFDDEPFRMGNFDAIARSGHPDFLIGGRFHGHCHTAAQVAFERGRHAEPMERGLRLKYSDGQGEQELRIDRESDGDVWRIEGRNFRFRLSHSEISYANVSTWLSQSVRRGTLPFAGEMENLRGRPNAVDYDEVEFGKLVSHFRSELPLPAEPAFDVRAIGPAKPRDRAVPVRPPHLEDPGGVDEIGRQLGLWRGIEVLGRPDGRFEIVVETPNGKYDIADVGYGVHSLLPLASAMARQRSDVIFLLEQPEVHVHPSAQARLARLIASGDGAFVIETHSDHLVDHFRICVMQGVLDPEELSIVYFESSEDRTESRIHTITVDDAANLVGVPDGYRAFFQAETERLLGIGE